MRSTIKVVCDRQRAGETADALAKMKLTSEVSFEEELLLRELEGALRDAERGTPDDARRG